MAQKKSNYSFHYFLCQMRHFKSFQLALLILEQVSFVFDLLIPYPWNGYFLLSQNYP